MKKLLVGGALLLSALSAAAVEVDAIAAQVDSDVILKSDVISELRRSGMGPESYHPVLVELVERKLILKAAADMKMTMQEWVVDNRVREIVQKAFDGDRNRLVESLAREKVSYNQWRDRMRDDMVVAAMRWQIVDKNAVASPSAIRAEYQAHPERYAAARKTTVSVILLKPEEAEKRDDVLEALKEEPFGDVARRYSSDANAREGGVWKDVDPEQVFRPEVCTEIATMKIGDTSDWIDLDGWSFLLRKDAEVAARAQTFAEAFDQVEANVKEAEAARLYAEWIGRLKAAAYVKIYE